MENEKRLIDANLLSRDTFHIECEEDGETFERLVVDWLDIESAPTVEVVHGRFKFACVHNGKKHYKCTNCHHAFPFANVNYCPNCGAKMDGGSYEND